VILRIEILNRDRQGADSAKITQCDNVGGSRQSCA